ncbi:hypothetical protein RLEG3_33715 [Rhizobium leguminosarum bv. trifolii WSM1689]|nr:hypothetical protein RLEG3_33715 [Rhizobium leguminosarum bv. trifolii WSM1689]
MFLGGDSPREAANFGIPKRGNFGIPKWDFFFGPTPGLCRGNRPAVSDVFLSGSIPRLVGSIAPAWRSS